MSIANVALTDTYDQWRIKTNQLILFGNELEKRQNTVFDTLNASYIVANSSYGVANSNYNNTNLVFTTTNAVYTQSNTDNVRLTSAYVSSNGAWIRANALYVISNANFDTTNAAYTSSNINFVTTNAAFTMLNTAFTVTNSVFTQANTDNVRLTTAFVTLNSAYTTLNAGYVVANSGYNQANTARDRANDAYGFCTLLSNGANVAVETNQSAYNTLNTAFTVLNTAYTMANANYVLTNSAFTVTNSSFTRLNAAYTVANAVFTQSNTDNVRLTAAYTQANTDNVRLSAAFVVLNVAFTQANTDNVRLSASYTSGNANYVVSNAAFGKANAALANTTGVFSGSLTITGSIGLGTTASAFKIDSAGDLRSTGNTVLGAVNTNTITFYGSKLTLANNTLLGNTANTLFIDVINNRVAFGNTNPPLSANVYFSGSANVDQVLIVNGVNVAPTITSSYGSVNIAFTTVNAAYVMANANYTVTNAAFTLANSESVRLTAAFGRANNTVPASTGGTFTGDITTYRSASPTTGYVFLNSTQTRYIGFDGSNYVMVGAGLTLNGGAVWTSANDGAGSGLDADLLDGLNQTSAATGSTICARDSNGDSTFRYVNSTYMNSSDDVSVGSITYLMGKFGDNYYRSATAAKVAAFISGQSMNIAGNATTAGNITAYTINQSVGTGNSPTFSSVYAQSFIDSNDNNYVLDPNGISYLNDTRSNIMYDRNNTGYYIFQNDGTAEGNGRLRNLYVDYLQSYGTIYSNGNITAYSDRRLKTNLQPITDWKTVMRGLKGYRFEWNDIGKKLGMGDGIEVGLITQEVEAVLPQATAVQMSQYVDVNKLIPRDDINYDASAPYKTVKEEKIVPVLVEAINGLMAEIEELKAEIKSLKGL